VKFSELALVAGSIAGCATLAAPARPTVQLYELVTDADYPIAAMRYEQEGRTAVVLGIGETGRVTDCRVTESSGHSALDAATCSLLVRRARFTPARDAKGNAIRGSFATAIKWVLPPRHDPAAPII